MPKQVLYTVDALCQATPQRRRGRRSDSTITQKSSNISSSRPSRRPACSVCPWTYRVACVPAAHLEDLAGFPRLRLVVESLAIGERVRPVAADHRQQA
jgi:hypothetical protein